VVFGSENDVHNHLRLQIDRRDWKGFGRQGEWRRIWKRLAAVARYRHPTVAELVGSRLLFSTPYKRTGAAQNPLETRYRRSEWTCPPGRCHSRAPAPHGAVDCVVDCAAHQGRRHQMVKNSRGHRRLELGRSHEQQKARVRAILRYWGKTPVSVLSVSYLPAACSLKTLYQR